VRQCSAVHRHPTHNEQPVRLLVAWYAYRRSGLISSPPVGRGVCTRQCVPPAEACIHTPHQARPDLLPLGRVTHQCLVMGGRELSPPESWSSRVWSVLLLVS
jgi:hypothetical protein